ncbi:MAG: spore germination protein [Solirubrobacterales bacterium]
MENNSALPGIDEIQEHMEILFKDCPDIIRNNMYLKDNTKVYYAYVDGLVDTQIMYKNTFSRFSELTIDDLSNSSNPLFNSKKIYDMDSAATKILEGNLVIFVNRLRYALYLPITKFFKRDIQEPEIEKNIKGAHDGFVESLSINTALLREKIINSSLKFKTLNIGSVTHQRVIIAYIDGIANSDLLNTLYNKISSLDYDGFIGSCYIQQMISVKYTYFPTIYPTERPDKAVAALMEGRFVVLVDGNPVALIAPVNFFSFFQAPDDYNINWVLGSFTRLIRYLATALALMLPPAYIALASFHYYMIPLPLLIPFAESRAKVPFPPIIEALIMEIVIDLIRESSVRLPSYVGITIGVSGGIILGQATVQAGIVSNIFLIVIGVTVLASYAIPSHDMILALRFTRIIFMILSGFLGIFGIVICASMLLAHFVTLESIGHPYLRPVTPFNARDLKDTLLRLPFNFLKRLPEDGNPLINIRGNNHGK